MMRVARISHHHLARSSVLRHGLASMRDLTFDKPYSERFLSVAKAKLSEEDYNLAWKVGLRMTMDEG